MSETEEMELQTMLLIIGACGVLIVLLYSIAMGINNNTLSFPKLGTNNDKCPGPNVIQIPKRIKEQGSPNYNLSKLPPVGTCPYGYTFFTDSEGNSLCCGTNKIDTFTHSCSATGPDGVCAMAAGIEDTRNISGDIRHYPLCQEIATQQQQERSGKLCPRIYPNHVTSAGGYKCCSGNPNASKTDCLGTSLCTGLGLGQNMFNTPNSCETERLYEKLSCPPGTNLVKNLKGTSVKTKDLSIPVCVGVQGNCIDRPALDALRAIGLFQDINPDKNIMNCNVYNKVYNERLWSQSQAEMKHSSDLK